MHPRSPSLAMVELISAFSSAAQRWGPSFILAAVLWVVCKAVYNVYFHPLAKYPGPALAAASLWWQIWVEVVNAQSLSLKLIELHSIYGMFHA